MTAARILTQAQAEAVYSAMCALNNVGAIAKDIRGIGSCRTLVLSEEWTGLVEIRRGSRGPLLETYENQAAFATAYGLNSDEPQSAVAAAAGGLAQTAIER